MAHRDRAGPSPQYAHIENLYSEPRPHSLRQGRTRLPRTVRNRPKVYTATSYIGPPGTYNYGQRPPPEEFEPDYDHQGEDRYGRPAFATPSRPIADYEHSAQYRYHPVGPFQPTAPRVTERPTMIAYNGRPYDRWERCCELGCTQKGLHYHSVDEQPLEHKREQEVYSDYDSPDDDYRDWRRRRAAKQKKAGHAATYRRPRGPKSLIAPGTGAMMELKEALLVPSSTPKAPAPQPQRRHPKGEMTLPLRPSVPPRERWASSPPPAAKKRRVATEDLSPAPGLPLRRAAPQKETVSKGKAPVVNQKRSAPEDTAEENALPYSSLHFPSSPVPEQEQSDTTQAPAAKKRRLIAAKDLSSPATTTQKEGKQKMTGSSGVKKADLEPGTVAGRLLRRRRAARK